MVEGTVTWTWKVVAVSPVTAPNVAPGIVEVRASPLWNPVPVTVSVVVAPIAGAGRTVVSLGAASTVRQPVQVAEPAVVVMVTLPAPSGAVAATFTLSCTCVAETKVLVTTVIPVAEKLGTSALVKPVPVTVNTVPVDAAPIDPGATEVTVGNGGTVTALEALPPSGFVTVSV